MKFDNEEKRPFAGLNDAEKGWLLLAALREFVIESWVDDGCGWSRSMVPAWKPHVAYRIKPEPQVETVTLIGNFPKSPDFWAFHCGRANGAFAKDTHRITVEMKDGEPDCGSIKMEKIREPGS